MSLERIGQRQLIGTFFRLLEVSTGAAWLSKVSLPFNSDQAKEEYVMLTDSPAMREWVGGRNLKEFLEQFVVAENVHYEASVKIRVKDLRRDKTGQLQMRLNELVMREINHWNKLASAQIVAGPTTISYDTSNYFDTTHQTLDSGVQSNMIDVDISTLPIPTDQQGSTTSPSAKTMNAVIFIAIQKLLGFKDTEGEPAVFNANSFHVLCPTSLFSAVAGALNQQFFAGGETNSLTSTGFAITFSSNPYLDIWTDQIVVFRTDTPTPALILQSEKPVMLKIQGAGSAIEFSEDKWHLGIDAERAAVLFEWRNAVHTTLI